MRQVIKHRDITLLKMIRRTDPVIPQNIPVIRLFEVIGIAFCISPLGISFIRPKTGR